MLELSETIEDGVRREVYEETGIKVGVDRLTGVYKNVTRGVVALVFRCHPEGGHEQLSDETAAVEWLTPEEVTASMGQVYSVRIHDALRDDYAPLIRTHDGRVLLDQEKAS